MVGHRTLDPGIYVRIVVPELCAGEQKMLSSNPSLATRYCGRGIIFYLKKGAKKRLKRGAEIFPVLLEIVIV